MAKKPASFEYNGTLVKVLDVDTIDAYIDLRDVAALADID